MVWSLCRWVCRSRSAPLAEPERTVGAKSEPKLPRRARSSLRPRSGRREGGTHPERSCSQPRSGAAAAGPSRRLYPPSTHHPGEGSQAGRMDLSQHCQETANSSVQPQEAGTAHARGQGTPCIGKLAMPMGTSNAHCTLCAASGRCRRSTQPRSQLARLAGAKGAGLDLLAVRPAVKGSAAAGMSCLDLLASSPATSASACSALRAPRRGWMSRRASLQRTG